MSEMKEFEEKMGKSVDALQEDYATIRAGRANPHILDKIKVLWNTDILTAGCQHFRTGSQNDSDPALGSQPD